MILILTDQGSLNSFNPLKLSKMYFFDVVYHLLANHRK